MSVAIIGAGASGLTAALHASHACDVVIYEKQGKPGRKILASGNGKCNITNRNIDPSRYYSSSPSFVKHVLDRYGLEETESFFLSLGIPFTEENLGRLFPLSLQASSVVDILVDECRLRGVDLKFNRQVTSLVTEGDGFRVTTAGREDQHFDNVILAAGSRSYPSLGGCDDGYDLARSLGHSITPLVPSIVPVNIPDKQLHRLKGTRRICGVSVEVAGFDTVTTTGEVQFTPYGLSGPALLDVSRHITMGTFHEKKVIITLDLFPGIDHDELRSLVGMALAEGNRKASLALNGMLRSGMPGYLLYRCSMHEDIVCSDVNFDCLVSMMKGLELVPGTLRGFSEAFTVAGGVSVNEVDPSTMESRIVPGLYITGEVLDVDGDSGGFSLQFAWSTGALAGMAVC